MIKQILLALAFTAVVYSQTCSASVTNCDTCVTGNQNACANCSDGFGLVAGACTACTDTGCLECDTTVAVCTKCDATLGYNETASSGDCACKNTHFFDTVTSTCKPCSNGCINCTSASVCFTCNTAANFATNGTSCRCADGFYLNANNTCSPCTEFHAQCLTCTPAKCSTCSGDYIVNTTGTNCVRKCNITGCLNCFNSTVCTSCGPDFNISSNKATCTCNSGFFLNNGACSACISNCASCTASTGCTTCASGFRFNSATATCVSGYYLKLALAMIVVAIIGFTMWDQSIISLCTHSLIIILENSLWFRFGSQKKLNLCNHKEVFLLPKLK